MSGAAPATEVGRRPPPPAAALPFGGRIGRFRLVEILGQGGMGTVYLAEQTEPVTRQVALKIMRSVFASAAELARFEGEREALARLTHPAIAQMYEAGTVDEAPWFAMELVRGKPLTTFADLAFLPLEARLELFVAACRGVQFAHQKGIIHRDLKPSNVLVTEAADRPIPKIIDFGIAKAEDRPLSDATLLTVSRIVGTPGYMSPEALDAGPGGADVDTRSDVYALGVILFELLCGRRPFDDETLGFAALARVVTAEDPRPPSQRLASLDADMRGMIAAFRGLSPGLLARRLPGDLDAIALKAVARDRDERYESVAALAADVERTLRDEPISARPPSIPYRLRKFVKRHRAAVSVAALLGVVVVGAVIAVVVQSARARRSEARATAVAAFLKSALDSADPWGSNSSGFTVREMLDQAVPRVQTELKDNAEVRAEVLETIGNVYFHLGERSRAEPLLREVLALRSARFGEDSVEAAAALHDLAMALPESSRKEAAAMLRHVIGIRTRERGGQHPSVARAIFDLSGRVDAPDEQERLLRESLRLREAGDVGGMQLGFSLRGLGAFLVEQGRLAEAEPLLLRALSMSPPDTLVRERSAYFLGLLRLRGKRWIEAEGHLREALGISERVRKTGSVERASIARGLGAALREQGRLDESEPLLLQAFEALSAAEKEQPGPLTARALTDLGLLSLARGDRARARKELEEAHTIWTASEPTNPDAAMTSAALAALNP